MNSDPVERHFGTPLSAWIATVPDELDSDAVGLWQIIPALRHDFGLEDAALERAVREALTAILARGAQPVVGGAINDGSWILSRRYGDTTESIIDGVVAEWHEMGRDPDVGDVWFALPRFHARQ